MLSCAAGKGFYMEYIIEPEKKIKVCYNADICVVGGSCTGVFAAVQAARRGANVVIIEKQNCLGGVACSGLVNIWHSLYDMDFKEQIVAGLTYEMVERLKKSNSVEITQSESSPIRFDPNALKYELDKLVLENKIKLYLHTYYSSIIYDGTKVKSIIIDNKDGRSAINADFFIDATGDGDLMRDLGFKPYYSEKLQPPSSCFFMQSSIKGDIADLIEQHGKEFDLDDDWGWSGHIPSLKNIFFRADNHVFEVDCSKADDLTFAETEGRRKAYSFVNLLKKYDNPECVITALCSSIGIRETKHYETIYKANEMDLLLGKRYDDAVLNGTYRIDIHHANDNGITFKYLDGRTQTMYGKRSTPIFGDWRKELNITGESAKYYQIPFKILVQEKIDNIIAAGRMINADEGAFGALRVMVNLNQLGEAAGVAAVTSIDQNIPIRDIDGTDVRKKLKKSGSAL